MDSAGVITPFVSLSWLSQQWLEEELFQYSAEPLVDPMVSMVSSALVVGMLLPQAPQVMLPNLSVFSKFQDRAVTQALVAVHPLCIVVNLSDHEGCLYMEVAGAILSQVDKDYTQFLDSCDVMVDADGGPHPSLSPVVCLSGFAFSSGLSLVMLMVRLESHDCRVPFERMWRISPGLVLPSVGGAVTDEACPLSGDSTTEPASGSDGGQVPTLPRLGREVPSGVGLVDWSSLSPGMHSSVNPAFERSAAILRIALLAASARRYVHHLRVTAVCRLQRFF